jgi:hypothetical protein
MLRLFDCIFPSFAMQPVDAFLIPLAVALESSATSPLYSAVSSLIGSLTFLLLSPTSRPRSLRRSAAKPVHLLGVWDESLLARHGKLKLNEANSTIAGLYPLSGASVASFPDLRRLLSTSFSRKTVK